MSVVEKNSAGKCVEQCSACKSPLPVWEVEPTDDSRIWICSRCGKEYTAVLAPNYATDSLRYVYPERIAIPPHSIKPAPPEMLAFVKRFAARDANNVEKRSADRHSIFVAITAMELYEQLVPTGPPFQSISRNLSKGGMCFVNDRAMQSAFVLVQFSGAEDIPTQMLARVCRQRPLGPYRDIGTEFITKFATPAAQSVP